MRFGRGLAFVFSESWAVARKGWWLALLPSLPLLVHDVSAESLRPDWVQTMLWLALIFTATLQAITPYWVMRFIALGHDFPAALSVNRNSARTFAPYLATTASLMLALLAGSTYATDDTTSFALGAVTLATFPLLAPWSVTAPSGSTVVGPLRSAKLVLPHLFWAMSFAFVALIPLALTEFAISGIALSFPDVQIAGQSLRSLTSSGIAALFFAASDLVFVVSMFAIAHRAGVRISEDRTLAVVFE